MEPPTDTAPATGVDSIHDVPERFDAATRRAVSDGADVTGGYQVTAGEFEGPFDLLLHLILTSEVDLWEVRLIDIIDAYISEVAASEHVDLEIATEFLLIAAILIELKSKRLLPERERGLDDEFARYEERDLLLARLLDCKTFRDAAGPLADRIAAGRQRWHRSAGPEEPYASLAPDPLARLSAAQLGAAGDRVLTRRAHHEIDTDHIAPIRISVRDAIETVFELLPSEGPVSFQVLTGGARGRLEVVVRFLAVLELYKQGAVALDQPETFAHLTVTRITAATVDLAAVDEEWDRDPDADDDADVQPASEAGIDVDLVAAELMEGLEVDAASMEDLDAG